MSSVRVEAAPPTVTPALSQAVTFLSAFLLFSIEPLTAKRILPWFGGSAAVWSTCLVFYQLALLLGYLYARLLIRYFSPHFQAMCHTGLLLVSLTFLPIGPGDRWGLLTFNTPAWTILSMLTLAIGLPFVTLSATTPLVQHWLSRQGDPIPHRLFALSNIASLAALLAYPSLVEPHLDLHKQRITWTSLYAAFTALCIWFSLNSPRQITQVAVTADDQQWILPTRKFAWFALSACGSMLLLSITNHVDQNVAAVPLLWVLPLAVYLLTFVIAFSSVCQMVSRGLLLRLLAFALGTVGYLIYEVNSIEAIQVSLPIFLAGLFVCCLFCHSELVRLRPPAEQLSSFYLMISAGGAAGAIFVGLLAPALFSGVYELPVTLVLTAVIAAVLTWDAAQWPMRVLWAGVTGCMIAVVVTNVQGYRNDTLALRRSFYGSLRVVESHHVGPEQVRTLFHGTIEHGSEYVLPPRRTQPTTYYGPESGVGIVLRECFTGPTRVGIVGLGAGTLAAYGRPGDTYRIYELNGQVIDIAEGLFFYLRESKAHLEIVPGDARLSLSHEKALRFNVLVLDAFSGDAVPVHLLTQEAIQLYGAHLAPHGVLAFHVSNDFLDLAPVVKRLADAVHLQATLVRSHTNEDAGTLASDWVLVTDSPTVLENASIKVHSVEIPASPELRTWTDGYNNLLQVLKWPSIR